MVIEQRSSLCVQCGGALLPRRVDARFCSNRCRQAAYRLRVTASAAAEVRCCDRARPTPTQPESNGAVVRGNTAAKAVTANNAKARGAG